MTVSNNKYLIPVACLLSAYAIYKTLINLDYLIPEWLVHLMDTSRHATLMIFPFIIIFIGLFCWLMFGGGLLSLHLFIQNEYKLAVYPRNPEQQPDFTASSFLRVDDKQMVFRARPGRAVFRFYLTCLIFTGIIYLPQYIFWIDELVGIMVAVYSVLFTLSFFYILWQVIFRYYTVTFDRTKGTVRFSWYYYFPAYSIPFNKLQYYRNSDGLLRFRHPFLGVIWKTDIPFDTAVWSWIVQYMDMHRSLPEGDVLDAFREVDKLRLERLGDTRPFYPASDDFSIESNS